MSLDQDKKYSLEKTALIKPFHGLLKCDNSPEFELWQPPNEWPELFILFCG